MKIGIFGGSFNPPHNMHKNIALDLIKNKYLDKDNKPYQKYIEQELFLLKPNGSHKVNDEVIPDFKVFLTKKGVDKFINKFIKIGLLKK